MFGIKKLKKKINNIKQCCVCNHLCYKNGMYYIFNPEVGNHCHYCKGCKPPYDDLYYYEGNLTYYKHRGSVECDEDGNIIEDKKDDK